MVLPLSEKSIIANSIAEYVLNHPDVTDIILAYNKWVSGEQYRSLSLGGAPQVSFCLDIFATCMNKLTREQLIEIVYNEKKILIR